MKTEAEFRKAIDEAKANYLGVAETGTVAETSAASRVVTTLQAGLQSLLATGAKPCPRKHTAPDPEKEGERVEIEVFPVGMLKTPEVYDKDNNLKSGAVYEVGCPVCVEPIRARGSSPERAVERWNEDQFVVEPKPAEA